MTKPEAEEIIEAAIAGLPAVFRNKMDNLVIIAQARPNPAQLRRYGKNLLGLYEGVPLSKRGTYYSGVMPDKITIFYRNIADYCKSTGIAPETAVAHPVRHEIAHHFGIDDVRLRATGNY